MLFLLAALNCLAVSAQSETSTPNDSIDFRTTEGEKMSPKRKVVVEKGTGDINKDGAEDRLDVRDLMLYIVGYKPDIDIVKADFNHDGTIDMADVVALQKYILVKNN